MKIAFRYKHTTHAPGRKASGNEDAIAGVVYVIYEVIDKVNNNAVVCKGGRYADEYLKSYEPTADETDLLHKLQQLAGNRYEIRSRPLLDTSNVIFEAVKILTYEREMGEISWSPPPAELQAPAPVPASGANLTMELEQ